MLLCEEASTTTALKDTQLSASDASRPHQVHCDTALPAIEQDVSY